MRALHILAFIFVAPISAFAVDGSSPATQIPINARISLKRPVVVDQDGKASLDGRAFETCWLEVNAALKPGTVIQPRTMTINKPVISTDQGYSGLRNFSRGTTTTFPVVDSIVKAINCKYVGDNYWRPSIDSTIKWFNAVGLHLDLETPPPGLIESMGGGFFSVPAASQ